MPKLIQDVGINDANYVVHVTETIGYVDGKQKQKRVWICPFYQTWVEMLKRGYSAKFKEKRPTYKDVTVCEEWHLFSTFKAWMETQDWEGKELDKDLLFSGNNIYSPETCYFVSKRVNGFLTECKRKNNDLPIGVDFHKPSGKYRASIGTPRKHIGLYETAEEAHAAYAAHKHELAIQLANEQSDPVIKEALLSRYGMWKPKEG